MITATTTTATAITTMIPFCRGINCGVTWPILYRKSAPALVNNHAVSHNDAGQMLHIFQILVVVELSLPRKITRVLDVEFLRKIQDG